MILLCAALFWTAFADRVPVLIWSPRSLDHLPATEHDGYISQNAFLVNYLTPLLGKEISVIVVFLQDKLHVSDFSRYADVYNQESKGGAFKNVKRHLDEDFSLELPCVMDAHLAVENLHETFPGTVLDLPVTYNLSNLDFSSKGNYLVIMHLKPLTTAQDEVAAIISNDKLIGKVSQHLEKRNVTYTALYTAETSQLREKRKSNKGRQLLNAREDVVGGVFFNLSYTGGNLYAYLRAVNVCLMPKDHPRTFCPFNFTVQNLSTCSMGAQLGSNRTVMLTLSIDYIETNNTEWGMHIYNFSLNFYFKHAYDRWEILESEMSIYNLTAEVILLKEEKMMLGSYDPVIPLLYSFHCSSMEWYPKSMAADMLGYLVLDGFQLQPFNARGPGFLPSQDCVGFFSAAIWLTLLPVGLHLFILFLGIYMISSISTNRRFDDPNGKMLMTVKISD